MYWCHYSWVMMVELLLLLLLLLEMLLQSNRVMVEVLVVVVMLLLVKMVVVVVVLLLQWKGWTRARAGRKIRMLGVLNAVVGSGADGWEGPHNLRRRQNANAV
jgi:hypothetical protein